MSGEAAPRLPRWIINHRYHIGYNTPMKFDIYGRFQIDVLRVNDAWEVYRLEPGKRAKVEELVIPPTLEADEIIVYLDDIFHELSGFDQSITVLPPPEIVIPNAAVIYVD
jgi:hypothetical protein